jgi:hypothetical protein
VTCIRIASRTFGTTLVDVARELPLADLRRATA